MPGPDGLEERTAEAEERAYFEDQEAERLEDLADNDRMDLPSDLMAIASTRLESFSTVLA